MGAGTSSGKSAAPVAPTQMSGIYKINATKLKDEGNGVWSFETPGYGGGQVLDESESQYNAYGAMGGKLYGAKSWDENGNRLEEDTMYFYTKKEATAYIKDKLQQNRRNKSVFGK